MNQCHFSTWYFFRPPQQPWKKSSFLTKKIFISVLWLTLFKYHQWVPSLSGPVRRLRFWGKTAGRRRVCWVITLPAPGMRSWGIRSLQNSGCSLVWGGEAGACGFWWGTSIPQGQEGLAIWGVAVVLSLTSTLRGRRECKRRTYVLIAWLFPFLSP